MSAGEVSVAEVASPSERALAALGAAVRASSSREEAASATHRVPPPPDAAVATEAAALAALAAALAALPPPQAAESAPPATEPMPPPAVRADPPEPPTPATPPPSLPSSPTALPLAVYDPSPRLSVKPSFPKQQVGDRHFELRAGWRLSLGPGGGDDVGDERASLPPVSEAAAQSAFGVQLGFGVNTGAGIKDGSVGFKALGCGMQLGQRTAFSVFDNEISLDFRRLFPSSQTTPPSDEPALGAHSSPAGAAESPAPRAREPIG